MNPTEFPWHRDRLDPKIVDFALQILAESPHLQTPERIQIIRQIINQTEP